MLQLLALIAATASLVLLIVWARRFPPAATAEMEAIV